MRYEYQRRAPGGEFQPVPHELINAIFSETFTREAGSRAFQRLANGKSVWSMKGWEYRLVKLES